MSAEPAPREVLVFDAGRDTLRLADYPWLVATRVILKGGDADGGDDGYVLVELYDRELAR